MSEVTKSDIVSDQPAVGSGGNMSVSPMLTVDLFVDVHVLVRDDVVE